MEENKDPVNQPTGPNKTGGDAKPNGEMTIVGINLLILVAYTLIFKLGAGSEGLLLDAFIIFIHVVVCIGMAIGKKSGFWLLSAFLVLVIGFSTCYLMAGMH